jgi:hypothetical protein
MAAMLENVTRAGDSVTKTPLMVRRQLPNLVPPDSSITFSAPTLKVLVCDPMQRPSDDLSASTCPVSCSIPDIPTGPDVVGLESLVLPCRVEKGVLDPGHPSVEIWAPTCRYGLALYHVLLVWPASAPGSERQATRMCVYDLVPSGESSSMTLSDDWRGAHVSLRLVWLVLAPGTLDGLPLYDLVEALRHPLPHVREAALAAVESRE